MKEQGVAQKQKRASFVISEDHYRAISRLARARNVSRSVVVREVLDVLAPMMERTAGVLRLAEAEPKRALSAIAQIFRVAEATVLGENASFLEELDEWAKRRGNPPVLTGGADSNLAKAKVEGRGVSRSRGV